MDRLLTASKPTYDATSSPRGYRAETEGASAFRHRQRRADEHDRAFPRIAGHLVDDATVIVPVGPNRWRRARRRKGRHASADRRTPNVAKFRRHMEVTEANGSTVTEFSAGREKYGGGGLDGDKLGRGRQRRRRRHA